MNPEKPPQKLSEPPKAIPAESAPEDLSPKAENEPEAVENLTVHALPAREQLMRLWPSQNWEKR